MRRSFPFCCFAKILGSALLAEQLSYQNCLSWIAELVPQRLQACFAAAMISRFYLEFYVFCFLLGLSTVLVTILFSIYHHQRMNLLLRSCSCIIFTINLLIGTGLIYSGGEFSERENFCFVQAVILNYCYLSVQTHCSSLMVNNLLIALRLRFFRADSPFARTWMLILLSHAIPLLPTLFLGSMHPTWDAAEPAGDGHVYPGAFFCTIDDPVGYLTAWWHFGVSLPGIFAAWFLLYKIGSSRHTLAPKTVSQFGRWGFMRLALNIALYTGMAIIPWIPSSVDAPPRLRAERPPLNPSIVSPWIQPLFCAISSDNVALRYEQRIRCPRLSTFIPPLIGIVLFLIYGFSASARETYKLFWAWLPSIKPRRQRRQSMMPLMSTQSVALEATPPKAFTSSPYLASPSKMPDISRRNSAPILNGSSSPVSFVANDLSLTSIGEHHDSIVVSFHLSGNGGRIDRSPSPCIQ